MALSCGIVGLPMVGKTTLFNLLTKAGLATSEYMTGKTNTHTQLAQIPDERVDFLAQLYKPKKVTYATLEVTDVPGLVRGASQGMGSGNEFLSAVQEADALIHVVRAFNNGQVMHVEGSIDIIRDLETINLELLFADLQLIEKRISRINQGKKKGKENAMELSALEKLQQAFENEIPLSQIQLTEEERESLRHMRFLTAKPMIIVVNVDEEQLTNQDYPQREAVRAYAREKGLPLLEVCLKAEVEIDELDPEDRAEFMGELGIAEPGVKRIAKTVYEHLGLISFLTVGEDEVKAWTITKGLNAKQAAGKIHSDIERGFIRAETVSFTDLFELGSMAKVKEKGLARLEGKDYIVQDGDIINFRFNV
ncbi:MAG TPA: redox-regulated ATPase YchF [Clostridia bacterium]|nr:redox-regulated ATPase YchF [Clostridia bacterium]